MLLAIATAPLLKKDTQTISQNVSKLRRNHVNIPYSPCFHFWHSGENTVNVVTLRKISYWMTQNDALTIGQIGWNFNQICTVEKIECLGNITLRLSRWIHNFWKICPIWYVCCCLSWGYIIAFELPYCVMNITLNNNTIQKHFCSTQNPSFDWVPLLENPGWNNVASLACNAPYNTRNPQEYRVSHKKNHNLL